MNSMIAIDSVYQQGHYCLNNLPCAIGGEKRHKSKYWCALWQIRKPVRIFTEAKLHYYNKIN